MQKRFTSRTRTVALVTMLGGAVIPFGFASPAGAGPAPDTNLAEQAAAGSVPAGVCWATVRARGSDSPGNDGDGGFGASQSATFPVNATDVVTALNPAGGSGGTGTIGSDGDDGGAGHGVHIAPAVAGASPTSDLVAGGGGGEGGGGFGTWSGVGGNAVAATSFGVESPGLGGAVATYAVGSNGSPGMGGPPGTGGAQAPGGVNPATPGTNGAASPTGTGGNGGDSDYIWLFGNIYGSGAGGGGGGGWSGGGGSGGSTGTGASGGGGAGSSYASDAWMVTSANDPRDEKDLGTEAPATGNASVAYTMCDYDLAVTKVLTTSDPITAGTVAEYDITVTNNGPDPMSVSGDTVTISDEDLSILDPEAAEFAAIDPAADVTYTANGSTYGADYGLAADGTRCTGTDIKAGLSCAPLGVGDSYTVHVKQLVSNLHPNDQQHCNGAMIDGDRPGGVVAGPESATEACADVLAYDLETTKTAPETTLAGLDAVWTINVANLGPANMEGPDDSDDMTNPGKYSLLVTDDLLTTATSVVLPPECMDNGDGTISCEPLAAGASYDITVNTPTDPTAPAGTIISNTACGGTQAIWDVFAVMADTDLVNDGDANDCATAETELVPPDLGITKTAPTHVAPGDDITWTVTVTNASIADYTLPQIVTDATLTGIDGATVTAPAGCTEASVGVYVCTDPLPAGSSLVFTVVTPSDSDWADGTLVTNCASVFDYSVQPDEALDDACAFTEMSVMAPTTDTTVPTTDTTVPTTETTVPTTDTTVPTTDTTVPTTDTTAPTTNTTTPGSTTETVVEVGENGAGFGETDTDGDGIPDNIEIIMSGTATGASAETDTDKNGVPDWIEIGYCGEAGCMASFLESYKVGECNIVPTFTIPGTIDVTLGGGFATDEDVVAWMYSTPTEVFSGTLPENRVIALSIPSGTAEGEHKFMYIGTGTDGMPHIEGCTRTGTATAVQAVTTVAPTTAPAAVLGVTQQAATPRSVTGAMVSGSIALGAIVLLAGIALVLEARRRREG